MVLLSIMSAHSWFVVMQVRLEAMEVVVNLAQQPAAADNSAVFVQAMAHVPGWDEKNFQASDGTWMHAWQHTWHL